MDVHGVRPEYLDDFNERDQGGDGLFRAGEDGVLRILSTRDGKVEFIVYRDKTLAYVRSQMGHPALYPLREARFVPPAKAVLMDLDGTSVRSEGFWVWIIERTIASLLEAPHFAFSSEDMPHVSGDSVSEHLQYSLRKYCPSRTVEEARKRYFEITRREMKKILEGSGKKDAFVPRPGLKEFLLAMKKNGVRIALVTSGLYEKAWPEIVSAFRRMGLGDPKAFYDAIITAGYALRPGQVGTLGELEPKPHPWLYAEAARVGLGIGPDEAHRVVGIEDSGAGVAAVRLAGFGAIGLAGGNIESSGVRPLLFTYCETLEQARRVVLGG